jgi:uncharacterized protein YcfJ
MRAWILIGSLAAAVGAAACGTQVAQPVEASSAFATPVAAPETTQVVAERKPDRSWKQRALVIGGSSGAGAGLGALIGGSKGALIGAAIGGGAGTVYEMQK